MSFRKIGLVCSPLLLSVLPLGQASAQGSGADAFAIEEIVVTARRREESLQDTPIAVTAYTEDEMDLRGHLNITDISQSTPNVNIEQAASVSGLSAAPTVFIRGVGQLDFVINTDPAVGVYVDGVYIARSIGSMMDLMDLERAEVLRGPQGTLFGRNTLAGAVNLISRRPTMDEFNAKLTLAAGENDYAQFNGAFNIPITDNLAARVSMMQRQKGGYVRANPDFYDDLWLGDDNTTGFRGQLEFLPSDAVRVNLSADYTRSRAAPAPMIPLEFYPEVGMWPIFWNGGQWMGMFMAGAGGIAECATPQGQATNRDCYGSVHYRGRESYETTAVFYDIYGDFDPDPTNEVDVTGGAATIEVDTAIGTFKSITAYRGFVSDFRNDHDYTEVQLFSNINDDFHQDGRSQEFQLVGNALDGRLDYTAGLYAFAETGTEVVSLIGVSGQTVTRRSAGTEGRSFQRIVRDIDNTSDALYGQITYHFEQPFHLTVGLRATEDTKAFDVTLHRDFCPDNPADPSYPDYLGGTTCNGDGRISRDKMNDVFQRADGSATWSEVDPMLSLAYDVNDTTMVYGTYATGFRDGGYASRFPEGTPNPIPSFDPEYVTNIEFGAKTELADGSLRLNTALFHTTYDNMQVSGKAGRPGQRRDGHRECRSRHPQWIRIGSPLGGQRKPENRRDGGSARCHGRFAVGHRRLFRVRRLYLLRGGLCGSRRPGAYAGELSGGQGLHSPCGNGIAVYAGDELHHRRLASAADRHGPPAHKAGFDPQRRAAVSDRAGPLDAGGRLQRGAREHDLQQRQRAVGAVLRHQERHQRDLLDGGFVLHHRHRRLGREHLAAPRSLSALPVLARRPLIEHGS